MKKLICSLMVAAMAFNTVISVEGLNRDNSKIEIEKSPEQIQREHQLAAQRAAAQRAAQRATAQRAVRPHMEGTRSTGSTLLSSNLQALDNISSEGIINILDCFELNDSNLSELSYYLFINKQYLTEVDIVDIYFYLVNRGVTVEQIKQKDFFDIVNLFLETCEGRRGALDAISHFCRTFGTVCILATGDIIDSDGKIYDYKGEEYNEEGLDLICEEGRYWYSNSGRLIKSFNNAYGIFILPDGRCFSCSYKGTSENKFIDLGRGKVCDCVAWTSEGTREITGEKIIISTDGVTLDSGTKFSPKNTGNVITGDIEEYLLKEGISQVVFDLVRRGNATDYVNYVMEYLYNYDDEVKSQIYESEETLKNFVIDNFCRSSLSIALQCLENKYNMEHSRS